MPNVAIDVIPGPSNTQSTALTMAVQGRARGGGTPTTPALTGALQTAKEWQLVHPERALAVLFMTDGQPTGCAAACNTVMGAAMVAQAYANETPRIRTYVLGVGPDTGSLDAIAQAGGTTKAYMATSGSPADVAMKLSTIAAAVCGP
jgi:Mg-chelatase subunit ChlD